MSGLPLVSGRCDLRVDRSGVPFMLEINPNCGVYYLPEDAGSADLCLAHDPAGHAGFTRRLIRTALHRHRQRALHRVGATPLAALAEYR